MRSMMAAFDLTTLRVEDARPEDLVDLGAAAAFKVERWRGSAAPERSAQGFARSRAAG